MGSHDLKGQPVCPHKSDLCHFLRMA